MPIIKSAKKRVLVSQKKKEQNNTIVMSMKTAIKKVDNACKNKEQKQAKELLVAAIGKIDKTLAKGLIHKNTANRYKARLTKNVNNMK